MFAGKDADAEGEAVVLAAELVHPVFGDGGLALADLDADVGVLTEAFGSGVGGDEVVDRVSDLGDNVNADLLGHGEPPASSGEAKADCKRCKATGRVSDISTLRWTLAYRT